MFARRDDRDDKKPISDAEWAAADALEAVWESDVQPDADLQLSLIHISEPTRPY